MPDPERLDPALLSQRERDEEPQLHELRHGEVPVELFPQRIVCDVGVPDDRAGVGQRNFSRSVNRADFSKLSSSSYCSSLKPFRPAWAERWTPQYSQSIDFDT